jgi:hypothetical protein
VNKLAVIALLLGLPACSHKKPEEGRETGTPPVVGSALPGAPAEKPAGSAAAAPSMAAAPAGPVGCSTAAALTCGADQVDGCSTGLTTVHVCIDKTAKAGAPCAQELALTCPSGQADGCLQQPPHSGTHVCVVVAAAK